MTSSTQAGSLGAYPTERRCPFGPPTAFEDIRAAKGLVRVDALNDLTPWLVTRYEDAKAILGNPSFSARHDKPGFPLMTPSDLQQRDSGSTSLVRTDDPEHLAKRRRLTRDFTVKRIQTMRPEIQRVIDESIDELLAAPEGQADLVARTALPIPSRVICLLLGVPYDQHAFFQDAASRTLSGRSDVSTVNTALTELGGFVSELIDRKIEDPGDDVLSRLAHQYLEPGAIDRQEMVSIAMTLLIAGFETTSNMISLGTALLLTHPDQLEAFLAGDASVRAGAIEEMLRYLTIAQVPRQVVATEDTEVGGTTIREGEGVLISLPSTNRDDSAFDDPDTFDIHRSARHHLAFSYGPHQCLGQALARQELLLFFETLFTRVPTLRLVDDPERFDLKTHGRAHGFRTLNVTW